MGQVLQCFFCPFFFGIQADDEALLLFHYFDGNTQVFQELTQFICSPGHVTADDVDRTGFQGIHQRRDLRISLDDQPFDGRLTTRQVMRIPLQDDFFRA